MEDYIGPGGWVKVHRKIVGWRWASSSNHMALFMQLLLRANFKETKWRKETILPGQLLTGSKQLSDWTGLSRMQVRRALKDLEDSGELTSKATNKYSIITLTNWSSYQSGDQQATNKEPTSDQQVTTSKNANNINKAKNEKNIHIVPSPLSVLFDHMPEVQAWLNEGNHDAHLIAVKKFPSSILQHELPNLYAWSARNGNIRAENWILRRLEQIDPSKPSSKAQKPFSGVHTINHLTNEELDLLKQAGQI